MFVERPLKSKAGKPKRLVNGIGINDAWYATGYTDAQGKRQVCPFYVVWSGMLERVLSGNFHQRQPTYQGCTVEEDWKTFSKFRSWMEQQDWQGKCLDKDLLVLGNKHYGPDTCLFVPRSINSLTVLRGNGRGTLPLGVTSSVINGRTYYIAKCSFYGKQKTIGSFKTPGEAEQAYLAAKKEYLLDVAVQQTDPRLKQALINFQASL